MSLSSWNNKHRILMRPLVSWRDVPPRLGASCFYTFVFVGLIAVAHHSKTTFELVPGVTVLAAAAHLLIDGWTLTFRRGGFARDAGRFVAWLTRRR